MDQIQKYLEAEGGHFAVEQERYGGSYRAIVCHRSACEFIFDNLEGDDLEGTQMQSFFWDNPLFPSATGNTTQEAIASLDAKLKVLYTFKQDQGARKWKAIPNFELKATHDCEDGEDQTQYDVSWLDIINDLDDAGRWFYEEAKEEATSSHRRDLHALINFKYTGDFLSLR
ncbi:hypothetical protein [Enterovibrio norvegicus]|uniref:hypothetical protein n=1 Tax=Enterovibrio norvegicus TaxID=188144 RepID=UPI00352D96E3